MRIPMLNTYRGIAILMVFLYHALGFVFGSTAFPWDGGISNFAEPPLNNRFYLFLPLSYGHGGVAVFFVVSGFCIHLSYLQNPSWQSFFRKRFFRIFPPYIAVLIALVVFQQQFDLIQIITHVFMVHNFSTKTLFGINGSFWTIAVEFQLYLLYPLLIFLVQRWRWKKVLIFICLVELVFRLGLIGPFGGFYLGVSPFTYWFSWTLGAYLAHRVVNQENISFPRFIVVGTFILAAAANHFLVSFGFSFPLFAIATFMSLANLIFSGRELKENFLTKHLAFVGICSYSFYLLHQPLLFFWIEAARQITPSPFALMILSLPAWFAVLGISYFCYKYIEQPSAAFGKSVVSVRNLLLVRERKV